MPSDPLLDQGPQSFPKGPERSANDPVGQPPQSTQGTQASGLEATVATLGSLAVHAALGLAMLLAIDVKEEEPPVVQAELWSSLPAELAANAPVAPAPTPSPPAKEPAPARPSAQEAEIALAKKKAEEEQARRKAEEQAERDRLRKAKEAAEQKRLAEEKAERDRLAKEKAERAEKDRLEKLQQARLAKEKAEAERRKKLAEEKAARERAELEQRRKEAAERIQRIRQEQLAQVKASLGQDPKAKAADKGDDVRTRAGVAGGAEMGDRTGVLADYAASIRARIRSRISFDPVRAPDNPEVIFVVEQESNGRVVKVTKKKSSGNAGWDAAVERAIWGSSPLPKTADGQVENPLTLAFRPLDRPQTPR
ncbi:MAG: cell envelope integrity protein TolA [Burkholderiaceae bacterium]